jgi:hypothetical protein
VAVVVGRADGRLADVRLVLAIHGLSLCLNLSLDLGAP